MREQRAGGEGQDAGDEQFLDREEGWRVASN